MLWAVLAGFVVGLGLVAVVAASDSGSRDRPKRLPALALPGGGAERAMAAGDATMPALEAVEIRVQGTLPALDGAAAAWRVAPGGDVAGQVATLARRLGLQGDVRRVDRTWRVVNADESGAALEVFDRPGLPWSYRAHATCEVSSGDQPVSSDSVTTSCAAFGDAPLATTSTATATTIAGCRPCPPDQVCADACVPPEPAPVPPPVERPANLPSRSAAEGIARRVLGLQAGPATAQVEDAGDRWFVQVDPTVDGTPTWGWSAFVAVGDSGVVQTGNGWLAEPVRGEDYPLAGTDVGLDRLRRSPWGVGPQPLAAANGPAEPAIAPGEPAPGGSPVVRTVTGVELRLAWTPTADGDDALLVPVYLFRFDDGGTTAVLAVADEYLPPEPEPEPKPEPAPVPVPVPAPDAGGAGGSGPATGSCAGWPATVTADAANGPQPSNQGPTTSVCHGIIDQ